VNELYKRAEAVARLGGDEALFGSVAKLFIANSDEYCVALEAAMRAANAVVLRREAHTVKSMLATFSCTTGTALAQRLEDLAATGNLDGAPALTDEVVVAVKRLVEALASETS